MITPKAAAIAQAAKSKTFIELLHVGGIAPHWLGTVKMKRQGKKFRCHTTWTQEPPDRDREPDLYFNVGLQPKQLVTHQRGDACDVVAIPGFWADVDFADKPNAKKPYPTEAEARKAIAAMPLEPSLVVRTAGGLHVYWLFDELLEFSSDAERKKAASISEQWQAMLRQKLNGKALDSTADLARMMRLPGSVDSRNDFVIHIESSNDLRYSLDQFEQFTESMPEPATNGKPIKIDPVAITPAEFPQEKIEAHLENDSGFNLLWNRKAGYPSASEYDMAIAGSLIAIGCNDSEVDAAIQRWRSKHGESAGYRRGKVERTILKVRTRIAIEGKLAEHIEAGMPEDDLLATAEAMLKSQSAILGTYKAGGDGKLADAEWALVNARSKANIDANLAGLAAISSNEPETYRGDEMDSSEGGGEESTANAQPSQSSFTAVDPFDLRLDINRTDEANARRLRETHGLDMHYVDGWKKWTRWNGSRWEVTTDCRIKSLAKEVAINTWKPLFEMMQAGTVETKAIPRIKPNLGPSSFGVLPYLRSPPVVTCRAMGYIAYLAPM